MANTFTWFGGSGFGNVGNNWVPAGGPPGPGDIAIINSGTVLLVDGAFNDNTIEVSNGTLSFTGDMSGGSSFDADTLLTSQVGEVSTAGAVVLDSAGIFVNDGTIAADGPAGSTFTLEVNAYGTVAGDFAIDGLITIDASNSMTFDVGANSELTNAGTIDVASAGTLVVSGTLAIQSGGTVLVQNGATVYGADALVNFGNLVINGGTLSAAAIIGAGTLGIIAGGTLVVTGTLAEGETIAFSGSHDLLALAGPPSIVVGGTIEGFVHFATLDLTSLPYVAGATAVLSGNTIDVTSGGTIVAVAGIDLTHSGSYFTGPDGGTGTEVIACFLAGTRIATPAGERAIETLRIGDAVLTQHGGPQRVKWIGRRSYSADQVAADAALRPILIAPGALGDGVPHRTLAVSPMHALVVDGLFILAAALVNGVSIRRSDANGPLDYLHLEFAAHEVVLAEGAAAESFVDEMSRDVFDNVAEYYALYGVTDPTPRRAARTEDGYALDAVRRRLAARAGIHPEPTAPGPLLGHVERLADAIAEGWVLDEANPTIPVELEAWHDGARLGRVLANRYRTDLDRAGLGGGRCAFRLKLPPGAARADLAIRRAQDGAAVPMQA